MPFKVEFYECIDCGKQYPSWSQAEACEEDHEYEKEQDA